MKTDKKNLRRISIVVTAQTKGNLDRLAAVAGYKEIGRVVDKLVREKMISLHDCGEQDEGLWRLLGRSDGFAEPIRVEWEENGHD